MKIRILKFLNFLKESTKTVMFQNPIFKTSIDLEFKVTDKYFDSTKVNLYLSFNLMLGLSANHRPSS